jgi:DNA-binding transcriptional LysR family regulator
MLCRMELRDLHYLRVVAYRGHLGRAAEHLRLTQPALTKCIARLEHDLKVQLLERTPKGVRLTACGEHLLGHAERLHAADLDIRRELTELNTGEAGHLRLGTGIVASQSLLPDACIALLNDFPGITLDIISGNSESLFPALRERRVDIVLASVGPTPMVGLRTVHLMDDEVSVIARRGHRMLAAKRVNARSLAGERWVMPADGTLPAAWLEHRMRALKLDPPRCAIRTGTFPTLLGLVAGSDLLAFQSWPTIERLPQYGELLRPLPLKSLTWKRAIGATIREQDYRSPAIDRVLEALKAAARRMQAG